MKRSFLFLIIILPLMFNECRADNPVSSLKTNSKENSVIPMTNATFKKVVFNYEVNKEWKFEGSKPAIIDFYADWCPPCRQLSPLVEEIAKEYSGRIDVYKVDTDKETTLAQALGITNLPTLLFIPAQGKPQTTMGAIPKESLVKAINEILLIK
ncbi:MAG TPA: thioredoxin [Bacteroidales bacterium]|nr:thioredoxin [Bacteroidales bacterium]HBZ20849.1 thioredoxin [Bacteroidales bacterium]